MSCRVGGTSIELGLYVSASLKSSHVGLTIRCRRGILWQPVSMTAVLILIVLLLAIAVAALARRVVNLQRRLDRADARQKAAVNTSRSVHVGKIAEQLAPLLPGFPNSPRDVQWAGGAIDAIVWDGLEEKRDDLDIVFLDVKTGQARLNDRQRRIRDAAEAGRVRFEVFRPETGLIQDASDVPVAEVPQIETVIIPPPSELDGQATLPDRTLLIELPDNAT